jgi:hypothetical protein
LAAVQRTMIRLQRPRISDQSIRRRSGGQLFASAA